MIRTGLLASLLLIALAGALSAYGFAAIPPDAAVAIHWNIQGEADGFAPRDVALLLLPALMVGLALIFALATRAEPRSAGLAHSRGALLTGWIGAMAVLLLAHGAVVLSAAGLAQPPLNLILVAVSILFVLLGNLIAKSRSNYLVGVRTRWSLSSEDAWVASNRATGWGFAVTGAVTLALLAFGPHETAVLFFVAGALASGGIGILISYLVWRRDGSPAR